MSNQEITTIQESNNGFMQVNTLESAVKASELIAKSNFCPQAMANKPGDVLVALQLGQELGLKPMQAIQNIAVINGRPSVWGDAALALCRIHPSFEYIIEEYDEATQTAICKTKRKNQPENISKFSMQDAKIAKLYGKAGPWSLYPKQMCKHRARGFGLRDTWTDVLKGLITSEEARDYPARIDYSNFKGNTIDSQSCSPNESYYVEFIDAHELSILRQKLSEAKSEEIDICSYLKIGSIEEMTSENHIKICAMLDKKIEKIKAEAQQEPVDATVVEEFFKEDKDES